MKVLLPPLTYSVGRFVVLYFERVSSRVEFHGWSDFPANFHQASAFKAFLEILSGVCIFLTLDNFEYLKMFIIVEIYMQ